jgi:hypothetical protein
MGSKETTPKDQLSIRTHAQDRGCLGGRAAAALSASVAPAVRAHDGMITIVPSDKQRQSLLIPAGGKT